ncbi:MAG: apolipoprotein N-acyltransferase [Spirochaetia bacterium]|nr:apolipoprotein N-acyltransferase [Spirochaetia bacterium]
MFEKVHPRLKDLFLVMISSICITFSFAPFEIWPLGFLALLPVFYLIDSKNIEKKIFKESIILGLSFAVVLDTMAYYWIIHTITVFGHLSYPFAFLIFLLYAAGTSVRFILFFIMVFYWNRWKDKTSGDKILLKNPYVSLTGFWVISEFLGWQLFPWYGGNIVSGNHWFIQTADIWGIRGVSIAWFIISFGIYRIIILCQRKYRQKEKIKIIGIIFSDKSLLFSIILFFFAHIYGIFADWRWTKKENTYEAKNIAVIQGNTPLAFENTRNIRAELNRIIREMVNQTLSLANEAKNKDINIDLLVWPESAVPFLQYKRDKYLQSEIQRLQNELPVEFIFSDIDSRKTKERGVETFSNVWLLSEDGDPIESYQKIYLLPFGEYMPLGDVFPFLKDEFREVSNFNRGYRHTLLPSKIGNLLPLVCYEVVPPEFTLDFYRNTKKKANIIINLTNDKWFGETIESYQHMELGRIRAIELRIPIIRSTNSGISAYIDTVGNINDPTDIFTRENRLYNVKIPQNNATLFSFWGNIPVYLFIFFFCALWVLQGLRVYNYRNTR